MENSIKGSCAEDIAKKRESGSRFANVVAGLLVHLIAFALLMSTY